MIEILKNVIYDVSLVFNHAYTIMQEYSVRWLTVCDEGQ